jgi:hypothetical protein
MVVWVHVAKEATKRGSSWTTWRLSREFAVRRHEQEEIKVAVVQFKLDAHRLIVD